MPTNLTDYNTGSVYTQTNRNIDYADQRRRDCTPLNPSPQPTILSLLPISTSCNPNLYLLIMQPFILEDELSRPSSIGSLSTMAPPPNPSITTPHIYCHQACVSHLHGTTAHQDQLRYGRTCGWTSRRVWQTHIHKHTVIHTYSYITSPC